MDSRQALSFAAGAALGAGALWLCNRYYSEQQSRGDRQDGFADDGWEAAPALPPPAAAPAPPAAADGPSASGRTESPLAQLEEDEVLEEQLTRNLQFFGAEGQRRIGGAFVVVVGLGGVGSHAAHLLLRSGVGRLRLIDFDQVTLSSLNRHCLATRADVGTPKATCLARHFRDILPEASVEACVEMYTADAEERLLAGNPDFVLDAIDNIDTKVALLAACRRRNLPVLCVAGAGAKADPTRVRILDLAESSVDRLARAVRHRLRRDHGIESDLPVLLSTEAPRCGLIYVAEEAASNPLDYQVVPGFRVRTIPVLGTTPAIFGLAAAAHILCALAQQPIVGEPIFRVTPKAYAGIHAALYEREELRFGTAEGVGVDAQEVEALVRELWRGRSVRAIAAGRWPADKALQRNVGHLALTRWDASKPAAIDNLVLLTHEEADEHDERGSRDLAALRAAEPEFVRVVEEVLARARRDFGLPQLECNGT